MRALVSTIRTLRGHLWPPNAHWPLPWRHLGGTWDLKARTGQYHKVTQRALGASKRALVSTRDTLGEHFGASKHALVSSIEPLGRHLGVQARAGQYHADTSEALEASKCALAISIGTLGGTLVVSKLAITIETLGGHLGPQSAHWSVS